MIGVKKGIQENIEFLCKIANKNGAIAENDQYFTAKMLENTFILSVII